MNNSIYRKKNRLISSFLIAMLLSGCSSSQLALGNKDSDQSDEEISTNEKDADDEAAKDASADDSTKDSSSEESQHAESVSDRQGAGEPWKSPAGDYYPESPYSHIISCLQGTTELSYARDVSIKDLFSGTVEYACQDITGDGTDELLILTDRDGKGYITAIGYWPEKDKVCTVFENVFNRGCQNISTEGFITDYSYVNSDGDTVYDIVPDKDIEQTVYFRTGSYHNTYGSVLHRIDYKTSTSEYKLDDKNITSDEFEHYQKMTEETVSFQKADSVDDVIAYLKEADNGYDEKMRSFLQKKQNGEGIFANPVSPEAADNVYATVEEAYDAFMRNETSIRCAYELTAVNGDFEYVYGDKYTLQELCDKYSGEASNESVSIDCGNDGDKEMCIAISSDKGIEPVETDIVVKYSDGHLYMLLVGQSSSRSALSVDEKGCIRTEGSSGADHMMESLLVIDANGITHHIYDCNIVGAESFKQYIPDGCELAFNSEKVLMYVYDIDGEIYYSPKLQDGDDEYLTRISSECAEKGIQITSEDEVNAIIDKKKKEYGI